jgi:hypothetical protein
MILHFAMVNCHLALLKAGMIDLLLNISDWHFGSQIDPQFLKTIRYHNSILD